MNEPKTLNERIIQCRGFIGKMCSEGRCPKMSIPANPDRDEDIIITRTLNDAQDELIRLRNENEYLKFELEESKKKEGYHSVQIYQEGVDNIVDSQDPKIVASTKTVMNNGDPA